MLPPLLDMKKIFSHSDIKSKGSNYTMRATQNNTYYVMNITDMGTKEISRGADNMMEMMERK